MVSRISKSEYHRTMPRQYGQRCPMARSLDIIGDRWTLLVVRDLLRGPCRFQDLEQSLSSVPPGTLSTRLRRLEDRGIVGRRLYRTHPPRAEYRLTKKGLELREVVRSLTIWGAKHLPGKRALVHAECLHPIEMAYRCAHCDRVLALDEIEFRTEESGPLRKPSAERSQRRSRRKRTGYTRAYERSPAAAPESF
jgi:DNA-binding HxlR family transcriptional regulator